MERPGLSNADKASLKHTTWLQLSHPGAGIMLYRQGSNGPLGRMHSVLSELVVMSQELNTRLGQCHSLWVGNRLAEAERQDCTAVKRVRSSVSLPDGV